MTGQTVALAECRGERRCGGKRDLGEAKAVGALGRSATAEFFDALGSVFGAYPTLPGVHGRPGSRSSGARQTCDASVMSVRLIFRCQFCDAQADAMTQLSLEQAMRENTWGAYQDALPGRWLVFHGRGLYGSARYACPDHRGDLVAYLREHFGTIGSHVWKRPPYPSSLAHAGTDRAWISATRGKGGGAF